MGGGGGFGTPHVDIGSSETDVDKSEPGIGGLAVLADDPEIGIGGRETDACRAETHSGGAEEDVGGHEETVFEGEEEAGAGKGDAGEGEGDVDSPETESGGPEREVDARHAVADACQVSIAAQRRDPIVRAEAVCAAPACPFAREAAVVTHEGSSGGLPMPLVPSGASIGGGKMNVGAAGGPSPRLMAAWAIVMEASARSEGFRPKARTSRPRRSRAWCAPGGAAACL